MLDEVRFAIEKMKNDKAPGIAGATTDRILKNLTEEGLSLLTSFVQQFWEDPNCDYEFIREKQPSTTHKLERHTSPKESSVKIISTILARRLLINFENSKAHLTNSA